MKNQMYPRLVHSQSNPARKKNTGSKSGEKKLKDELQYQHKIVPTLKTSRNASEKALLIQTRSCICLSTPPKHTDAHQKLEKHIVNEGEKALLQFHSKCPKRFLLILHQVCLFLGPACKSSLIVIEKLQRSSYLLDFQPQTLRSTLLLANLRDVIQGLEKLLGQHQITRSVTLRDEHEGMN